jgi:integrase
MREGRLIPNRGETPTFEEYARGWWEWDTCGYLKKRRKRHDITRPYADNNKKMMENRLIPYFGKMKMDRITRDDVESWLDSMMEAGYQNTYTNTILGTLKTMMIEAVDRKVISENPAAGVEKLVNDRRDIEIITRKEFGALFLKNWRKVWNHDRITYTANKLAALTGMRSSEVLGLKGEYVFEDHIYLCKQNDEYGYRDTKTKESHNIPVPKSMIRELRELTALNGGGFVFSLDGGGESISRRTMYNGLHRALNRIGINDTEISRRSLHLHAWRHFCNTELQNDGVAVAKVQAVTGHKSERMTERYTHFNPAEFSEVREAQENLLRGSPAGGKGKKAAGKKGDGKKAAGKRADSKKGAGKKAVRRTAEQTIIAIGRGKTA